MDQRVNRFFVLAVFFLFHAERAFSQEANPKMPCVTDQVTETYRNSHGEPVAKPMNKTVDDSSYTYVIPVVFHIFHENGPERNVTFNDVLSEIEMMNQTYNRYGRGFNDNPVGARANIKFCLASIDPDGNPTTGIEYKYVPGSKEFEYSSEADSILKSNSLWDPERYLNFWTVGQILLGTSSAAGYAFYPGDVAGSGIDGCVVDYGSVGWVPFSLDINGVTPVHEAAHWLGVYHPWGFNDSCDDDDECDDTPKTDVQPTDINGINCNVLYTSCSSGEYRQVENYMDYSNDKCQNVFTKCQVERMRNSIINYRPKMVDQNNLRLTGCSQVFDSLPIANRVDIYPNPAASGLMVYFDIQSDDAIHLTLINMEGRKVLDLPEAGRGRGVIGLDIGNIASGMYQLILETPTVFIQKTVGVTQ